MAAKPPIINGYAIAARIWRFSESRFSIWSAIRSSASSSIPADSPVRVIAT